MRNAVVGLTLGSLVVLIAACTASGGAATPAGGTGGSIEGTSWRLASLAEGAGTTEVPDDVVVDATFSGGRVTGSGGCNAYNGTAAITGATITVGPLATTQKACEPPASDIEQAYLENLAKAATFTATADGLTIFDASGAVILSYEAGAANPLEGEWLVTGYNNGKQAVVSPIAGTILTAVFTADAVSGDGGCNAYNGGYTLDAGTVTIGPLSSTMKACEQAIMDQEALFLAALQTPATAEVTGGTLTLRDASGAMQVTMAPKP